jgi:spermidine synthase
VSDTFREPLLPEGGIYREFTVLAGGVVLDTHTSTGQHIRILDTIGYGRTSFLNDQRQSSAVDQAVYHEHLVHPAMFDHAAPQRVLILGGGEGATLYQVLQHCAVREVTQVDYDAELVMLFREHLGWDHGAYDDPRLTLFYADAVAWLAENTARWDVIIYDLPEWTEATAMLYTDAFFATIRERLAPGGLFGMQVGPAGMPYRASLLPVVRLLRRSFAQVVLHGVAELGWYFALAGAAPWERRPFEAHRVQAPLTSYTEATHARLGGVPADVQHILAAGGSDAPC